MVDHTGTLSDTTDLFKYCQPVAKKTAIARQATRAHNPDLGV
jgi:hypothetical protein